MTSEQRVLHSKLRRILDTLPPNDDRDELIKVWYRLAGARDHEQVNADWQRAIELLERIDPLYLGAALATQNPESRLAQHARAILARS
jgi:hypothetical protein